MIYYILFIAGFITGIITMSIAITGKSADVFYLKVMWEEYKDGNIDIKDFDRIMSEI